MNSKRPRFVNILQIPYVQIIVICLLGVLIYSNSFDCDFQFDDGKDIVKNESIRDITNIKPWWNYARGRPVAMFTIALNYHYHELRLFGYHLVNLIIHLVNGMLVFWLIRLTLVTPNLLNDPVSKVQRTLPFLGALLFITHPIQTQAVTYIIQRMTSLATLFYLLSLALYIKARLPGTRSKGQLLFFSGAVISAILGMMTKQIAFTLPFAVLLYEFTFLKTKKWKFNYRDIRFVTGLVIFLLLLYIIPAQLSLDFSLIFREIEPQQGHQYTINGKNYLFTQFNVIRTYIRLLFLPINQNLDYDYPISESLLELPTLLSFQLLVTIFIFGILVFKKHRLLSFGIFWFFLTLMVESSIIPIPNVIFEHRIYLPSFGFVLFLISLCYYKIWKRSPAVMVSLLLLLVLINSILTFRRNKVWKNKLTLWTDVVKKSPNKARPSYNLGFTYFQMNDYKNALRYFKRALKYNPSLIETWNNLGAIYLTYEKYDQALDCFNEVLKRRPGYVESWTNKGILYKELEQYEKSFRHFNQAIKFDPGFAKAYKGRGDVYQQYFNDDEKALADYTKAIELDSTLSKAYFERGLLYIKSGKFSSAIKDLDKTISYSPGFEAAFYNKGIALFKSRQFTDAIVNFTKAIELDSNYAKAYYNRSLTYALHKENYKQAWQDLNHAKQLGYDVDNNYYQSLAIHFLK